MNTPMIGYAVCEIRVEICNDIHYNYNNIDSMIILLGEANLLTFENSIF